MLSINPQLSQGFPSWELLVVGAIRAGLQDIRSNPYLLDYCFNWYALDDLTNSLYGEKARQAAKKWILNTEIFVSSALRLDLVKFPQISVVPKSSIEAEATLGDVNYDTIETVDQPQVIQVNPTIMAGPFIGDGYNYAPSTGTVTLPSNLSMTNVFVGMLLYDVVNNQQYPILSIQSTTQFTIAANVNINLTNAYIASAGGQVVTLESCYFKDTYDIYCSALNSADELNYLDTLVQFILLRYKQAFLEGRGFDRTTLSIGPVMLEERIGVQEPVFTRVISLVGYLRKYWPKYFSGTVQGFNTVVKIDSNLPTPPAFDSQVSQQDWELNQDSLAGNNLL